ncbi:MAG: M23 family metallopeptidase [Desulfobacterales bacterium]|nr:MAG: M23 family metallopeptidase [Desulfobacterales bacterium]
MSLKKSRFTEMLIEENALDQSGFDRWIFCRGMLFNSADKWWGDHGRRDYPHEGIDLCLYKDRFGRMRRLDEKTRIPVMHSGVVKAIFKDYLGHAVIIEHEDSGSDTRRFISFYAHTKPRPAVEVGTIVKEGDTIATLAATGNSKANILPHLHFSLGIPSKSFTYDRFVWNTIRNPAMIALLDPLPRIDWPYQTLEADNPACRSKLRQLFD